MSDRKSGANAVARAAGKGLVRAFRAIFGDRRLKQAEDSARLLKEEFEKGRQEADGGADVRPIGYRELSKSPTEEPRPGPEDSQTPSSPD